MYCPVCWSTPSWSDRRPGRLGGEEVRGPTSVAVPVDGTGTVSVAPVMAPPVPGVQKPPRQVGKRFWDRLVAAPGKKKVKRPAGLRTRPAWSAAATRAARCGIRGRASLKAADGNHLIP